MLITDYHVLGWDVIIKKKLSMVGRVKKSVDRWEKINNIKYSAT